MRLPWLIDVAARAHFLLFVVPLLSYWCGVWRPIGVGLYAVGLGDLTHAWHAPPHPRHSLSPRTPHPTRDAHAQIRVARTRRAGPTLRGEVAQITLSCARRMGVGKRCSKLVPFSTLSKHVEVSATACQLWTRAAYAAKVGHGDLWPMCGFGAVGFVCALACTV